MQHRLLVATGSLLLRRIGDAIAHSLPPAPSSLPVLVRTHGAFEQNSCPASHRPAAGGSQVGQACLCSQFSVCAGTSSHPHSYPSLPLSLVLPRCFCELRTADQARILPIILLRTPFPHQLAAQLANSCRLPGESPTGSFAEDAIPGGYCLLKEQLLIQSGGLFDITCCGRPCAVPTCIK